MKKIVINGKNLHRHDFLDIVVTEGACPKTRFLHNFFTGSPRFFQNLAMTYTYSEVSHNCHCDSEAIQKNKNIKLG